MAVDYNPQLGYRRTLFPDQCDFLVRPVGWEEDENGLRFLAETQRGRQAVVHVSFLTETIFRFQMFPDAKNQREGNPVFSPECREKAEFRETEDWYEYGTSQLTLRFRKAFWEMSVYSGDRLLTKEQVFDTNVDNRWKYLPVGYDLDEQGDCRSVRETMYLFSDEAFWGYGEKFTGLNKRGQLLHCWQKDALSTNTEDSYKAHPFFISSRGYGILLNTFTRCSFDMGFTSQVSYQMAAEDGCLDYIFLAGREKDYKGILSDYLKLTGQVPMIPKWAFGFWMSKCSYQSRQEIEEVVTRCQKEDIPIDVIHIDGWQKMEDAGTWEWDLEKFPDPEGMIRWLEERHVHLSLWIYPYLVEQSPMFRELEQKGYFVKNTKGETALFYAMADAPCRSACFDFTNPHFLAWYRERVLHVLRMGVSVIKTDFSEAVPEDAVYYDGTSGVEGHNKLTYLYAQTIYGLMEECRKETGRRPVLWGRSGYAGSHRIPAAWAGDSSSALNNHAAILRGGLSLAMSGVAFWGFDMGGFYNTGMDGNECPPSEEEYLRSVELGFWMPLSRAHGKTPREPWNFSKKVLDIVRKFDKMRHRMVPYLYSMAGESHVDGVPVLRPLLMEYPKDPTARSQELSYMLGSSLLVAPPFDRDSYEVYLPAGKWRNLSTDEIIEEGKYLEVSPDLEELPVFQRENTILPLLREEDSRYVPEGLFCEMEVQLFYEQDMETVFYDSGADGQLKKYEFRAVQGPEKSLYVDTDMNISTLRLISDRVFDRVYLNGVLQ